MTLPINNVKEVLIALVSLGIKNPHILIGTLCCIAKESGFVPKDEYSYGHTSNIRLRKFFKKRLLPYTEEQLNTLKLDNVKFFDVIYGGVYGNKNPGDGYKFRGRGFNQITFKDLYAKYGTMIKEDLLSNPDKLDEIVVASKACAAFFSEAYKHNAGKLLERFEVVSLDAVKEDNLGIQIAVNANAGWGNDTRGGEFELKAKSFQVEVTTIFNSLRTSLNV